MEYGIENPRLVFDFVHQSGKKRRQVFCNPVKVVQTELVCEVCDALNEIEEFVQKGYYAVGYIGYEAAPAFDKAYRVKSSHQMPLLWFGIFLAAHVQEQVELSGAYAVSEWVSDTNRDIYEQNIQEIKQAIARGDTYQVNYTMRFKAEFKGDDFAYYEYLHKAQKSSYSAYLDIGRFRILSLSPELFFKKFGPTLETRPMKGTVARGRWLEEDDALAKELHNSAKNRAENLMIVDLIRNDLSKISGVHSVHVPSLFEVETYPTVHQMTSTVTAKLASTPSLVDVMKALFPCGSITGAPKIMTMNLIEQLEQSSREVYCGTIGIIEPDGRATFNVAIRTMIIDTATGTAEIGVGGGVTWDSTPEEEYTEAFTKIEFLRGVHETFELLETMKLEQGHYVLKDFHLSRLEKSAQFFNIPINTETLSDALRDYAIQCGQGNWKVRLLVSQSAQVRMESSPLNERATNVQTVALATHPISVNNIFIYHKTTNRGMYEQHLDGHKNVFDVLLWNVYGNITEFTNGNVVLEIDGRMLTPALSCGLLPGTMREHLLREESIEEALVFKADLQRATRIWFINSVRGWVPVTFSST